MTTRGAKKFVWMAFGVQCLMEWTIFGMDLKLEVLLETAKSHHPEVILFSILSTLRTLYLWYQKRGKLDVNVLKKDMVAVLLRGIV